jgi:hypothetical protein
VRRPRGKHSRKTPEKLQNLGNRIGIDGHNNARESLGRESRQCCYPGRLRSLSHGFFVTADGKWTVVQQGMNEDKRQARRYHWYSASVQDFVDQPHSAIEVRFKARLSISLTAAPSAIIHDSLDRHYRNLLDQPITVLGNNV